MKMKILGLITFLIAFGTGLIASPIRFASIGIGHGIVIDGGGFYWIHTYESIFFVSLSHEGEQYETREKAISVFQTRLINANSESVLSQKVLEQTKERAIIHFERKDRMYGYCIFRIDG